LIHDRLEWWIAALMRHQAGEKVEPPPWHQKAARTASDEGLWRSLKAAAERNKRKLEDED